MQISRDTRPNRDTLRITGAVFEIKKIIDGSYDGIPVKITIQKAVAVGSLEICEEIDTIELGPIGLAAYAARGLEPPAAEHVRGLKSASVVVDSKNPIPFSPGPDYLEITDDGILREFRFRARAVLLDEVFTEKGFRYHFTLSGRPELLEIAGKDLLR